MSLSFIIEMAWKSAIIAGAALLLVTLLRSRSAADRAAVLRLAVALLLLLPVIAIALPALQVAAPVSVQPLASAAAPAEMLAQEPVLPPAESAAPEVAFVEAGASIFNDWEVLLGFTYLAGLLAMGLRLSAGLFTLRRWTVNAGPVTDSVWLEAFAKADKGGRNPQLLVSHDISAPISWGWRQPVILIDSDSLDRTEDADAIIVHEMAHVVRQDWVSLILARTAVAFFWINPLVWLMEREIIQQAEEAADSHALAQVDRARYAQTLVTCAKRSSRSLVPANSMAASGSRLARRVKAILDGKGTPSGSRWTLAAMVGCIGFAAPVAALQLIPAAPPAPVAPLANAVPDAPAAPAAPVAAMIAAQAPAAPRAPAAPQPPVEADSVRYNIDIDEEAIERVAEEAGRYAERVAADAERIAARAERDAERAVREGERAAREGEKIAKAGERLAVQAKKHAAASMAAGAKSMMNGANSMEDGARQMDREAAKLHDRQHREMRIAEAAARGQRLTHEKLIASIPELKEGAREMREGAKEMRVGAEEMRRQSI